MPDSAKELLLSDVYEADVHEGDIKKINIH